MWRSFNSYYDKAFGTEEDRQITKDELQKADASTMMQLDLKKEMNWIISLLDKMGALVVFSHNDYQCNNILKRDAVQNGERTLLIDFEYSAYNYRYNCFL